MTRLGVLLVTTALAKFGEFKGGYKLDTRYLLGVGRLQLLSFSNIKMTQGVYDLKK